jgi:hypothetical protein
MQKLKLSGRSQKKVATDAPEPDVAKPIEAKSSAPTDQPTAKPKRTRKPRVKLPRIISGWGILMNALSDYRAHWKGYMVLLAIVAVPTSLLALLSLGTADAIAQSYVQFASIVMNVAFLYAICRTDVTGKVPKPSEAYYQGTAALVRFLLVVFSLVIMIIPLSFGAALYVIGMQAASYYNVSGFEQVLVVAAALILASPSLYLLVRYSTAPIAVVRDGLRPLAALRRARVLTLGRFWPVAGRMVLLFPFLLVVSIPSLLVFLAFSSLPLGNIAAVVFQIVATLTVLPIGGLYFKRLYVILEESFQPAVVEKVEGITDATQAQLAA